MDKLITALAPVFAAGLGIQQLGEILSPVVDKISEDNKKVILRNCVPHPRPGAGVHRQTSRPPTPRRHAGTGPPCR